MLVPTWKEKDKKKAHHHAALQCRNISAWITSPVWQGRPRTYARVWHSPILFSPPLLHLLFVTLHVYLPREWERNLVYFSEKEKKTHFKHLAPPVYQYNTYKLVLFSPGVGWYTVRTYVRCVGCMCMHACRHVERKKPEEKCQKSQTFSWIEIFGSVPATNNALLD